MKNCSIIGCKNPSIAKGLCYKHYARRKKFGDPNQLIPKADWYQTKNSQTNRFDQFIQKDEKTGCWNWLGSKDKRGYGRLFFKGKMVLAHRFSYEQVKGKIPASLEIDHICRNTTCVNPEHLELVTHIENVRRGLGNRYKEKTHCKNGHEFTPQNTINRKFGRRGCKACRKIQGRNRYRKKVGIPFDAPPQKRGPK